MAAVPAAVTTERGPTQPTTRAPFGAAVRPRLVRVKGRDANGLFDAFHRVARHDDGLACAFIKHGVEMLEVVDQRLIAPLQRRESLVGLDTVTLREEDLVTGRLEIGAECGVERPASREVAGVAGPQLGPLVGTGTADLSAVNRTQGTTISVVSDTEATLELVPMKLARMV